jgi:hypothetical protein
MELWNQESLMDYLPLAYRTAKEHWAALGNGSKARQWEALEQDVDEVLRGRDDDVDLGQ